MRKETRKCSDGKGKHTLVTFDSLGEFVADIEQAPENDGWSERGMYRSWNGADSMQELYSLGRKGMPREGIEALALAETELSQQDRELSSQRFQTFYSVEGADVDVARYLDGEPECMLSYYMDDTVSVQRVVTLALGIGVNSLVSPSAFTKHGQRLVALAEAIDSTGLQSEMYCDFTGESGSDTGRIAIRVKAPGEVFDAGAFMFALTNPGMLRGLGFKGMQHWHTSALHDPSRTHAVHKFVETSDYPEGTIYIPAMKSDSDAGKHVDDVLEQLGLVAG